ncbi:guanylate kinase [bacterium CPR1]|nr:guanylate kinase [bacterium CPR1]
MKGLLLVVSGPSGVGKGTVLERLLSRRNDCVFSISATTRPARPQEENGKHYFFLNHEGFERWVEEGKFLEWSEVFDHFYGTPRDFVEQQLETGKNVVLDIDVQGGLQVMKRAPNAVFVFLAPPDLPTLRQRLISRGTESPEQIAKRLLTARTELAQIRHYAYRVINQHVDEAVAQLEAILAAELCRTSRVGRFPWEEVNEEAPA